MTKLTRVYSTQSRTGLLTAGQTSLVYFTARDLFDPAEIQAMVEVLSVDIKVAGPGLKEQYEVLQKWLADEHIPFIKM